MSLKYILLVFTIFLLVQSSFGRHAPVESSENELAPTESKDNEQDNSSEKQYPEYRTDLFLKKRKLILQSIHDVFEGFEEFTEVESFLKQINDRVLQRLRRNYAKFKESLSSKEKLVYKTSYKEFVALLHSLYESPKISDSEENEVFTVKDKKRIFLAQQILNCAYLAYRYHNGNIDEEESSGMLVDFYKETVQEYYDSLTKEEQEKKKPYMDWIEEQTAESDSNEDITDEEYDKDFELLSQFFDLTDVEKFKVLVFRNVIRDNDDNFNLMNYYKEQVEKYSDSLPNEKSKLKKKFADHLEKLNSTDSFGKQIKHIIVWMLTLKDDEE